MDQIIAQLIDYGLTQPQAQVRATVYQYGSNPASTIASLTKLERTHVYKLLTQLEAYGLVECHLKGGAKCFIVPDKRVIQQRLKQQAQAATQKAQGVSQFEGLLDQYYPQQASIPSIRVYEGIGGVQTAYESLQEYIEQSQLREIKCFASNTLEAMATSTQIWGTMYHEFADYLQERGIVTHMTIGQGVLLLEQMVYSSDYSDLAGLSTGQSSTTCWLAGKMMLVVMHQQQRPVAVTITSEQFVQMMHTLVANQ